MSQALKAIYRNGTFILQTVWNLPEGAEVELIIQSPDVVSPPISNSDKQRFLKAKARANAAKFDSLECSAFHQRDAA